MKLITTITFRSDIVKKEEIDKFIIDHPDIINKMVLIDKQMNQLKNENIEQKKQYELEMSKKIEDLAKNKKINTKKPKILVRGKNVRNNNYAKKNVKT